MVHYVESVEIAAEILKGSNRVMVVGCSGGGKSTLSMRLCKRFCLDFISMDRDFFWLPGWKARAREEQRALISQKITQERWLMDGSNPSSFDLRLPRTDIVLWVRMPRWLCLLGVYRRSMQNYGKTRISMAAGCVEKWPDREFLSYIWNFERKHAPIFIRNFDLYGPHVPVLVLKSRRDVARLLDLVDASD
ncbi:AAA family ATPase [Allorhizobium sp. BGMRC 0089]|uniref:AAA family ATPase n=1 Tax=Allorhizobium sonneratiae TaxID=2934936 RepID=UPI0020348F48|nr:AAA family ATPase [Allorhizobium sonneratiae]MCM2292858.1 AAA family ATPase [Allorhizobium sonneratiae]